jgi:PadR family transcriptional regulator PadR
MDLDRWLGQLRRGTLELCVMRVLRSEDAHGYEIVQRIKGARLLTIREATVYPVLQRLLHDGLVTVSKEASSKGPPRKRFSLTQEGFQVLKEMERQWGVFVESIESLR